MGSVARAHGPWQCHLVVLVRMHAPAASVGRSFFVFCGSTPGGVNSVCLGKILYATLGFSLGKMGFESSGIDLKLGRH